MKKPKISKTMAYVLGRMAEGGNKLKRFPGGFWRTSVDSQEYFGTKTVHALVTRGLAAYTEYKDGRNGPFPIEASLINAGMIDVPKVPEKIRYRLAQKLRVAKGRAAMYGDSIETVPGDHAMLLDDFIYNGKELKAGHFLCHRPGEQYDAPAAKGNEVTCRWCIGCMGNQKERFERVQDDA